MERQTLEITLYCDTDRIDMPLNEAVAWLQGLLAEVPPEFRDAARLNVGLSYGVYDDPTEMLFDVSYTRLETEAEAQARVDDEARRKEQSRVSEIARLRYNLERLTSGQ